MSTSPAPWKLFVLIPLALSENLVLEIVPGAGDAVDVICHSARRRNPVTVRSPKLAALASAVRSAIAAAATPKPPVTAPLPAPGTVTRAREMLSLGDAEPRRSNTVRPCGRRQRSTVTQWPARC